MTELPIVVNMTVDASPTEYALKAETNTQAYELKNDIVIDSSGGNVPVYQGPYTVTPSTATTTLLTDGKRCNDDIVVSALNANAITQNSLTVDTSTGEITSAFTVSPGYNDDYMGAGKIEQLDVQARKTVTPTTSEQIAVPRGKFTTGAVKVRAIPTGARGTPTATKGAVSNHAVSVTPSVTNTTGYITGGTINGTAVSVSASELVSGKKEITANGDNIDVANYETVKVNVSGGITPTGTLSISTNGTYDVTNYATADVSVSGIATGTFTPTGNTSTVTINTGLSSLTGIFIYPEDNPNLNSSYYSIYGAWVIPNGPYQKAVSVRGKGTSGRGFEQWISSNPPFTVTGGTIVISYPNASSTGYFTAVTYRWYAW